MVDLSHAMRLCNVTDGELIYFSLVSEPRDYYVLTFRQAVNKLDMKSISVHRIDIKTDNDGDWLGWRFFVTGISKGELQRFRTW